MEAVGFDFFTGAGSGNNNTNSTWAARASTKGNGSGCNRNGHTAGRSTTICLKYSGYLRMLQIASVTGNLRQHTNPKNMIQRQDG